MLYHTLTTVGQGHFKLLKPPILAKNDFFGTIENFCEMKINLSLAFISEFVLQTDSRHFGQQLIPRCCAEFHSGSFGAQCQTSANTGQ